MPNIFLYKCFFFFIFYTNLVFVFMIKVMFKSLQNIMNVFFLYLNIFQHCKESVSGAECVHPYKCLSQCKNYQFCTKDHNCQAPHNCMVDRDCKFGEECRENGSGRKLCRLPNISESIKSVVKDECGSSNDCQMLHPNKPVCKDNSGDMTCVQSQKCKCLESEVCSSDEKCVPSAGCESNDDCDDTKVCRNFIPGGRKTCVEYTIEKESGQPCITNEGCIGEKTGKTVCKESQWE